MNISRNNYEEWFILYLDNELGEEDRRAVEIFASENKDLKEELDLLLQSKLIPDEQIKFSAKEQLYKSADTPANNKIDEQLLLYIDNELTADKRKAVDEMAAKDVSIQSALQLLQRTKQNPDTAIIFPNKELLYRREEKVRFMFNWRRVAAAAAILLIGIGTTAIVIYSRSNEQLTQPGIASVKPSKKQLPTHPVNTTHNSETPVVVNVEKNNTDDQSREDQVIDIKTNNRSAINNEAGPDVAAITKENNQKNLNDLPGSSGNPNVTDEDRQAHLIAFAKPETSSLTKHIEINSSEAVTASTAPTYINKRSVSDPDLVQASNTIDTDEPGSKSKLRGFFRKVTRTFEKATNIKVTDDQDRLLVGGLAFKL